MTRSALFVAAAGFALAAFASPANGQEWARKMFATTTHDFGVVAKDAKTTFDFEFENSYLEDVHVASVRASCGCTTPVIVQGDAKTWEKGVVRAVFNTDTFTGARNATVTVTFDKPFFAEVQLKVSGTIRSDIVFEPGEVEFGAVDQGAATQRRIRVTSYGKSAWKIQDVRSVSDYLAVQILDEQRQYGKVIYDLGVNLKENAPAGYIQDQLTIVSNDRSVTNVPIVVTGRVTPSVTVSPQSLFLGDLAPGDVATKNLVVKSKTPIRIADVTSGDDRLKFSFDPEKEAALHLIPVTFAAGDEAGKLADRIDIRTSLGASVVSCDVSATIFSAPQSGGDAVASD